MNVGDGYLGEMLWIIVGTSGSCSVAPVRHGAHMPLPKMITCNVWVRSHELVVSAAECPTKKPILLFWFSQNIWPIKLRRSPGGLSHSIARLAEPRSRVIDRLLRHCLSRLSAARDGIHPTAADSSFTSFIPTHLSIPQAWPTDIPSPSLLSPQGLLTSDGF